MRPLLRGLLVFGGAGWLAFLWAGEESTTPPVGAAKDTHQVQKPFELLFQHPVSFSRRVRLPKGTIV